MIVLGIDAGPTELGWAEADCPGRRPRFIAGGHEAVPPVTLLRDALAVAIVGHRMHERSQP